MASKQLSLFTIPGSKVATLIVYSTTRWSHYTYISSAGDSHYPLHETSVSLCTGEVKSCLFGHYSGSMDIGRLVGWLIVLPDG